MNTKLQAIQTAALTVIAIALAVQTAGSFKSPKQSETQPKPQVSIVEVVGRVNTAYDSLGFASKGFWVRDGAGQTFVEYDENSFFDTMETPKLLKVTQWSDGNKMYVPLYVASK